MDPISLMPPPEAIPVSWVWLQIFLIATTFLHFLAMNIMLGSGFIALAGPPAGVDTEQNSLSRDLVRTLPYSLAFTINFGVAPLLFLQTLYGQFFYTSTVLMAAFWLTIVVLLIISYYLVYLYNFQFERCGHQTLLLGLPIAMFLLISFFFTNNISIMQDPASWLGYFSCRGGWMLNLSDSALLPRYLHFILSAIAVGGLSLAVFSDRDQGLTQETRKKRITYGCNWFTYSTIINFGVGFWFLSALQNNIIITPDPAGKAFFIMIIASVAFCALSVIYAQSYRIYKATLWTLATIMMMTVAREIARNSYLQDYINISELPVNPVYGPFIIFSTALLFAIWLIWWMMKKVCSEMEGKS
ncbi:MAG: hypothetical protein KKG47_05330 [Proteobacteria bacterium]|nr:hypothetical protein [Pseudomonadota bacterium]MBU1736898.1 hypothetical protein [Pseudomonadota bacterium]